MIRSSHRPAAPGPGVLVVVLAACLGLAPGAQARLYQWVNPASGTVEMSGRPPPWYRSAEAGGPRVQVYERGRLVDDTVIPLPDAERQAIRDTAFAEFEARQHQEALRRLERTARRDAAQRQAEEDRRAREDEAQAGLAPTEDTGAPVPEALDQDTVDRLKAIIQAWDRQQ